MATLEAESVKVKDELQKLSHEQQKAVVEAANLAAPNLGVVIENPMARKWIYGLYAILAIAVGATVAGFLAVTTTLPTWLEVMQAVVAYLAIPIGGLAAVNTNTGKEQVPARG